MEWQAPAFTIVTSAAVLPMALVISVQNPPCEAPVRRATRLLLVLVLDDNSSVALKRKDKAKSIVGKRIG